MAIKMPLLMTRFFAGCVLWLSGGAGGEGMPLAMAMPDPPSIPALSYCSSSKLRQTITGGSTAAAPGWRCCGFCGPGEVTSFSPDDAG
ncbi:hypothetical protein J4P02_11070 [Pseudomonas sp. NFXW11]|uniref:hypothetical protein n=1 Tax=Pseudomonas sp. NFXW11 TaxID=2819531 RepID=UPI003CE9BE06